MSLWGEEKCGWWASSSLWTRATWQKKNPAPPQLYQQLLQLIPSPNRYGLDTFYELHVWAWQDNPNGAFVDWNNKVNCNLQGTTL